MKELIMDFDEDGFRQAVEKHWHHKFRCHHIHWSCRPQPDEQGFFIEAAPVIQEIYGGENDGCITYTAFTFDFDGFFHEMGVGIEKSFLASHHLENDTPPYLAVEGTYWDVPFIMQLQLEPMADSEPVEVIDMLNEELRDKERQP